MPLRLFWNPNRSFDLDNHDLLLWMYENGLSADQVAVLRQQLATWPRH